MKKGPHPLPDDQMEKDNVFVDQMEAPKDLDEYSEMEDSKEEQYDEESSSEFMDHPTIRHELRSRSLGDGKQSLLKEHKEGVLNDQLLHELVIGNQQDTVAASKDSKRSVNLSGLEQFIIKTPLRSKASPLRSNESPLRPNESPLRSNGSSFGSPRIQLTQLASLAQLRSVKTPLKSTGSTDTTPLRSILSPTSSARKRTLYEQRERRNSRLFNSPKAFDTTALNDTLNLDNNFDILDFDQSFLPKMETSPGTWKSQHSTNNNELIETLKRQLTGYQLQIRFLLDFIHKNGDNELLRKLEAYNFNVGSPCQSCQDKDRQLGDLNKKLEASERKYRTAEDNLLHYQQELDLTNKNLASILDDFDNWELNTNKILDSLKLDSTLEKDIERLMDQDCESKLSFILEVVSRQSNNLDLVNCKSQLHETQSDLEAMTSDYTALKSELGVHSERIQQLERELEVKDLELELVQNHSISNKLKDITLDDQSNADELLKEIEKYQEELEEKEDELNMIKRSLHEHDATSSNLIKEKQAKISELSTELDLSLERERDLLKLKLGLNHELENLSEEKTLLHQDLELLQEQLEKLQTSSGDPTFWSSTYEELLDSDTRIATRFLHIFQEILDSSSIEQAKVKILELSNRSSIPRDQKFVKQLHESIFQYYVSGVQAIIQDYLTLIKQLEVLESDKNNEISKLNSELNNLLSKKLSPESNDEELLQLRIEELARKWKLEREARKLENDNLKKKLVDLENENLRLRKSLDEYR